MQRYDLQDLARMVEQDRAAQTPRERAHQVFASVPYDARTVRARAQERTEEFLIAAMERDRREEELRREIRRQVCSWLLWIAIALVALAIAALFRHFGLMASKG